MQLGLIHRHRYNGDIAMVCSGWVSNFGKVTLRHALDVYGFLIKPDEVVKTTELIKRVRAYQARSPRRDMLLAVLIASAWPREKKLTPRLVRHLN